MFFPVFFKKVRSFMKHRITYFSLFLSLVIGLLIGIFHYSLLVQVLFYLLFFMLVIFSYRFYLLIEKMGVYLHEKYFKKIFENLKTTKETIQDE